MTPAQRMALLEQAKALMSQAEADDTTPAAPAASPAPPATPAVGILAKPATATPATPVAPAASVTGPGGDTRVSGQPSLAATMRQVWANMKAASTPKKGS